MKQTVQEENRIRELLQSDPEEGVALALKRYGSGVKWIARRILGDDAPQDVEECVAETFVRLWQHSASFDSARGGGALYGYVCGIARHVAVDMARRRKSGASMEEMTEGQLAELAEEPDFAGQLADEADRRLLWEAVEQLPREDREIFLLRYWMELRIKRISQLLGLTEKQVENKLYRGRQTLRKELEKRGMTR